MDVIEEFKSNFLNINPLAKYITKSYRIEKGSRDGPWAFNCFRFENGYDIISFGITFKIQTANVIKNNITLESIGKVDKRTLVLLPEYDITLEDKDEDSTYYSFCKVKIEYSPHILYYYLNIFNNFDIRTPLKEDLEVKIYIKLEKDYLSFYSDEYSDVIIKNQ